METRVLIAYAIIALLVLAILASAAFVRYNSWDRRNARQRARTDAALDKRSRANEP